MPAEQPAEAPAEVPAEESAVPSIPLPAPDDSPEGIAVRTFAAMASAAAAGAEVLPPVEAFEATGGKVHDSLSYFVYLLSNGKDVETVAPAGERLVAELRPELLTRDGSADLKAGNLRWRVAVGDGTVSDCAPMFVDADFEGELLAQAAPGENGAPIPGLLVLLRSGLPVKTPADATERSVFGEGSGVVVLWP